MSGGLTDGSFLSRGRLGNDGGGSFFNEFRTPNLAYQQFVHTLEGALYSWPHIYNSQDRATIYSPMFWWQLRSDATFASAIDRRRQEVAGIDFWIKPADGSEGAAIVANRIEWLMRRIDDFARSRFNLTAGIFRGQANAAICGQRRRIKAPGWNKVRPWYCIDQLVDVDMWRFAIGREPGQSFGDPTHWQLYSYLRHRWERILHPEHFVWFFYEKPEYALGYGVGLNNSLYAYLKAKEVTLNLGLRGLRRWAMGILKVAVESVKRLGDERLGTDPQAVANLYVQKLRALLTEDVLAYDKEDDVDVLNGGGEGHQQVMAMLEYLDRGALRRIQHGDLTTGQGVAGVERGNAETQRKSQGEGFAWDQLLLDEALTKYVVGMLYRANRRFLEEECHAQGVELGDCPTYKGGRAQESLEPTQALSMIKSAQEVGMKVPESWAHEQAGIPMLGSGDEDRELVPPAPPGAGVAGGMWPGVDLPGVEPGEVIDERDPEEVRQAEAAAAENPLEDTPLAPDASAEDQAASDLLGKVGGITGWMQIAQSVAAGELQREPAIAAVMTFFRLGREEAAALIPEEGSASSAEGEQPELGGEELAPGEGEPMAFNRGNGTEPYNQRSQSTDSKVGAKIKMLEAEGKPHDQAVAIALDMERRGDL